VKKQQFDNLVQQVEISSRIYYLMFFPLKPFEKAGGFEENPWDVQ